MIANIMASIMNFIQNTQIVDQIREVDAKGLFTNAYFLVPFIMLVAYWLYKQAVNSLVLLALSIGLWIFSGSSYAQNMIVNGEMQLDKVLPVAGVGVGVIAVLVYIVFIRSD